MNTSQEFEMEAANVTFGGINRRPTMKMRPLGSFQVLSCEQLGNILIIETGKSSTTNDVYQWAQYIVS